MLDATDPQHALRRSTRVERYAEVLAHVVHFGTERTAEIVARFGFALEEWRAVDAAWTHELSEGIRRNQHDLALRFSAAFAKRRRRLSQEQPALGVVGDVPAPSLDAASQAGGSPARVAVALPSFMSAPPRSPEPLAPAERARPALRPVAPAAPGAAPAPLAPPTEKPITQALPAMSIDTDPLPFADGVAPEVALRAALSHAEVVQGPKPARPPSLGTTAPSEGDRLAAIARRILPFQSGAAAAEPSRDSDPGPMPGPPATPIDAASLTLEQHASLHVELALHPAQKVQTLRRYGFSVEQYARLDTALQAKIAQDAALRTSWEQACAQYRTWILRNKQRGA